MNGESQAAWGVPIKKPAGEKNRAGGSMLNPPIIARGSSDGR
jgi:hypothetical protein